jgi:hypothetical protein
MSGDNERIGAETTTNGGETTHPLWHPNGKRYAVPVGLRAQLDEATERCFVSVGVWRRTGDHAAFDEAQRTQEALFKRVEAECQPIASPVSA